jgi:hypothetical protein
MHKIMLSEESVSPRTNKTVKYRKLPCKLVKPYLYNTRQVLKGQRHTFLFLSHHL